MTAIKTWLGISAFLAMQGGILDMPVYDSGKGYKHIKHRSQAKLRIAKRR